MTLKKRKKKSYINQYLNVIVPYTTIAKIIQKFANGLGYEIWHIPRDYSQEDKEIMNATARYTMTDFAAKKMLIEGIKHIVKHQIEGCFVECGVWKGGSIIIMLKTLQKLGISDREIYLFDTFEGMSKPIESDVNVVGKVALNYEEEERKETYASLEEVKKVVFKTGYDRSKIHFVKGKVEDTLPDNKINKIALLRLDTDYYESTKAEFEFLYPKLSVNGVLIVDDYGVWKGARKATDEYLEKIKSRIFLSRINPLGAIIGIKTQ